MDIDIIRGDITLEKSDAIVNAANKTLLGGGGVDGAIHKAAGPELLEACRQIGGCPTGEARITPGFKLPAKYVIHTVGPVWSGGQKGEEELLYACYENSLLLAIEHKLKTIAFPCISTGVYHFPIERAAEIAISAVLGFWQENMDAFCLKRVAFICFDERNYNAYIDAMEKMPETAEFGDE